MNRRTTDEEVSRLPLSAARAELLEEIMRQDARRDEATGRPPERSLARRRTTAAATALGAAAAVAAVVTATVVLPRLGGGDEPGPATAPTSEATPTPTEATAPPVASATERPTPTGAPTKAPTNAPVGSREWVVLPVEGWTVTYVSDASGWREATYENGRQRLDVALAPAELRDSYVEDRSLIDHPRRDPGTPVALLGGEGLLWPYSRTDHTTIGQVEGERYPEVRGAGMDRAAYVALLEQLVWVDVPTFQASLPPEFADEEDRDATIDRMLQGMTVPDEVLPITSAEVDPYQLGADVAGAVACGWLDRFAAAKRTGDREGVRDAQHALAESRDWPVLQEMDEAGDYPEVVWEMADEVQRGRVPEGYAGALGCP